MPPGLDAVMAVLGRKMGDRSPKLKEAAAHRYPRWIACRSRCPRRRAGPARRAPRPPQDSLLSLLAQRAAPSRPLSTWLTPASCRLAACQPIKSLHHIIDDAQRTERT